MLTTYLMSLVVYVYRYKVYSFKTFFIVPQYPSIDAIKTVILVENPITGKYTISLNYTVTSHWKSLAVIWSLKFDVYCVQGTISRLGGASFLPASVSLNS